MRKYLSLTKVLMKSGFSLQDGKSKKSYQWLIRFLLIIALLPTLIALYFIIDNILPLYASMQQGVLLCGGILLLACMLIFIFSLFMIPSIFYFSKDIDILLALPLHGWHITAAKFTVCVLYETLFSAAVLLPFAAAWIHYDGFSLSICFYTLLTAFLLPIYPLVLTTLFTMIIMRFMPFFKNRDRFQLYSGILLVGFGIAFSMYMNSFQGGEEVQLLQQLISGDHALLSSLARLFVIIPYFSKAIIDGSIANLLIGIVICIIALILLLVLSKLWYFKGAVGINEAATKHKSLNEAALNKRLHASSKKRAYLIKELRLLMRTPVFAINCIGSVIILPLMLLGLYLFQPGQIDLMSQLSILEQFQEFPFYIVIIGLAVGLLSGSINMTAATALSREGSNYMVMKYLPMSYRDQIHMKALCGIIISILGNLLLVIAAWLILPFSWYYFMLLIGCMTITAVLANECGIIIDMFKPKLVWEQEAAAVKQSFSAFITTMLMMGMCIGIIALCVIIPVENITLYAGMLLIICIILAYSTHRLSGKLAAKAMLKL